MNRFIRYLAITVLVVALVGVGYLRAQAVGNCERSLGEAYLDANNVSARLVNTGGLFYRGQPNHYEVPKGSGVHSVFAGSLWIAGLVDSELRMSATRYGEWELWAGPIDDAGNPPADCKVYDHVYKVTKDDVSDFESSGRATQDLREWPTGLGAPTIDASGELIYLLDQPLQDRLNRRINLRDGERPAFRGDQALWWITNDRGNKHRSTRTEPLGIEVHTHAWSAASGVEALHHATFFRYKIFNKSLNPITDAYIGFYLDTDLGNFDDDFIGSDSALGLAYTYNADNFDEDRVSNNQTFPGYGESPPAFGAILIEGPHSQNDQIDNDSDGSVDELGERLNLTAVSFFNGGGGVQGHPYRAADYYNYMRGNWMDGRSFTVGAYGRSFSEIQTNFMFSGDPVAGEFWSEMNLDLMGTAGWPGDKRYTMSSGPFTLQPGEETDFTIAFVWARGRDNLDSVTELKIAAEQAKTAYFTDYLNNQREYPQPAPPPEPNVWAYASENYPEPFSDFTNIRYGVPHDAHVRITVRDLLGREIATLVDEYQPQNEYTTRFDAGNLPSGLYFYTIEIDRASSTFKMVLMR